MSQTVSVGRENRQNGSGIKSGVHEEVIVKTLPNSTHGRRGGSKSVEKTAGSESSVSRVHLKGAEGKQTPILLQKSSKSGASSNANRERASNSASSLADKKINRGFEDKLKGNGIVDLKGIGGSKDVRKPKPSRSRPNGSSGINSVKSGRVFTSSDKSHGSTGSHTSRGHSDTHLRSINDAELCRLLRNVRFEDVKDPSLCAKAVLDYISNPSNARSISKASQHLWDELLDLGAITERSFHHKTVKKYLSQALAHSAWPKHYQQAPSGHFTSRFFDWMLMMYDSRDDNSKIFLMMTMNESLEAGYLKDQSAAQELMEHMYNLLDAANSSTELMAVFDNVLYIAKHFPAVFSPVFPDIVDILIGWYLEPDLSDSLVTQMTNALISLNEYWKVNMHWCKVLTGQFLDDADGFCSECISLPPAHPDLNTKLHKITLLVRVFTTLAKAAGEMFCSHQSAEIEVGYVVSSLKRILACYHRMSEIMETTELLRAMVNNCILVLSKSGEAIAGTDGLQLYLAKQFQEVHLMAHRDQISLLSTATQMVRSCGVSTLTTLFDALIASDLSSLKVSTNHQVQECLLLLIQSLFICKDLRVLQTLSQWLKDGTESCVKAISVGNELDTSSKSKAVESIIFNLTCLAIPATETSNLILTYALEPGIFSFLLKDIILVHRTAIQNYPNLLVCLLRLLHLNNTSNKNYIVKSNLVSVKNIRPKLSNITVNKNSGDNFSLLLESMGTLLTMCRNNTRAMVLMTQWFAEILEQAALLYPELLRHHLVLSTLRLFLQLDDRECVGPVLLNLSRCVSLMSRSPHVDLTPALQSLIIDFCLHQMSCDIPDVRDSFLHTISQLPANSVIRFGWGDTKTKFSSVTAKRKAIMSGAYGSLTSENFRSVATILFKEFTSSGDVDVQTLQRALIASERPSRPVNEIIHDVSLLEFWCLWQAADFCVAQRLRTPIGKPVETFTCIESAIKQIAADKRVEITPKCGASSQRVWLLLQFLENLEKTLYSAYDGTAANSNAHNKIVKSFFRTNKGTCIEWLTRIRLHILTIASAFKHPATVIRHSYELITDMMRNQSTQTPEFELVLVHLTDALCQLNCSEAIQGLYEWCKISCNRKLTWIKALVPKSLQRFESAAMELQATLDSMLSPHSHVSGEQLQLQTRSPQPTAAVVQFCTQQVTHCYTSLHSWGEASDWLKKFDQMKQDHQLLSTVDPLQDYDKILMAEHADLAIHELMSWSVEQSSADLWTRSLGDDPPIDELKANLSKVIEFETTCDWPLSIQPDTVLSLQCLHLDTPKVSLNEYNTPHTLSWLLRLNEMTERMATSSDTLAVQLACCREARHTNNLKLAKSLMSQLTNEVEKSGAHPLSLRVAREAAKQMYTQEGAQDAALLKMLDISRETNNNNDAELIARSTLSAVKWLQSENRNLPDVNENTIATQLAGLHDLVLQTDGLITEDAIVPYGERVLGTALKYSTEQCQSLAKTWFYFGNWAYKWGRKCLDNADKSLSDDEKQQIESLLPPNLPSPEVDNILEVMSSVPGTFTPADEDLTDDSPDYNDDDIVEIRRRLSVCSSSLTDDVIDGLADIWMVNARNAYHLYEESAAAYIHYLTNKPSNQVTHYRDVTVTLRLLRLLVKHAWELRGVLETGIASTPTSPWRSIIPQLLSRLNHPESYVRQSVLGLLTRLSDDYPHLIIYPAMVGYKQSNQSASTSMPYMAVQDSDAENADAVTSSESKSSLRDCFSQLINSLSALNPDLITQVDSFVTELCRITVLWDELWLGSLGPLNNTAADRIKSLASEVERVKNNSSLSGAEKTMLVKEKRQTMVRPLIHTIERLTEITGHKAETKHEQWFQDSFGQLIEKGVNKLRHPSNDEDLQADWLPFKQLYSALQQRSQKRASHLLKMKDVSSTLATLQDTYIPLPGIIARTDREPVTLTSVYPSIQILPTKTKPKKLAFQGSDGQKYMYLFKGLEDLHLDERIMQLLNIVNDMLESRSTMDCDTAMYRARNYSVTPLGLRSGLIQWVDGCMPLFSLYKRWQVREHTAHQAKLGANSSPVPRPSEVFYSKLIPLLKQALDDKSLKDVKDVEKIRKDWPIATLITATKQLIADTPSHLVSKEMWCSSSSANEWWSMTQTYCRSVAVMSAIGYILGLGDRHLDNLLLDISNGEVVHIDYNVCFDKGKSLRVPERVPFRLTHNVVAAMGATGVEGMFRSACEHSIKCMRQGKETLLTLLEAFVYDPLVDWTVGGDGGLAGAFLGGNYALGNAAKDHRRQKKQMERDITRSMFSIRVTEMKSAWLQNKEDMASSLKEIVTKLSQMTDEGHKMKSYQQQLQQCESIISYVEELKHQGPQAVSDLIQRYDAHQKHLVVKDACVSELKTVIDELSRFSHLHQVSVESVTGPVLDKLVSDIRLLPNLGPCPSACTKAFLSSVGQVAQLDQLERYHTQLIQDLDNQKASMVQCIDTLKKYALVVSHFSTHAYTTGHVMADSLSLLERVYRQFTAESCNDVLQELNNSSRLSPPDPVVARAVSNEKALVASLDSDMAKLIKVTQRSPVEDTPVEEMSAEYNDSLSALRHYAKDGHGFLALMSCVLPKMIEVNRKYIIMEGTASRAGDRLHSLTSRDGDWFLDELACINANLLEYVAMATPPHLSADDSTPSAATSSNQLTEDLQLVISGVNRVYLALQDMVLNFQHVIVPGVLASMSRKDSDTSKFLSGLQTLVSSVDMDAIVSSLESSLRSIIFGTKDSDHEVQVMVRDLQESYGSLLGERTSQLTGGSMLLRAFDGLFTHIFDLYNTTMTTFSRLSVPKSWRKVDTVREAGAMQLTQFNEKSRDILKDLFFVKQLIIMNQFYGMAEEYSAVLAGDVPLESTRLWLSATSHATIYTDIDHSAVDSYDALSLPIRSFIAQFVRRQLLGISSQCVGFLVCTTLSQLGLDVQKEIELKDVGANSKVAIDALNKKGFDSQLLVTQGPTSRAHSLLHTFDQCWRRLDLAKRLTRRRTQLESLVSQQQHHLASYMWLHEELLPPTSAANPQRIPSNRKLLLGKLHRALADLMSTNSRFSDLSEKSASVEASISQRLKWASGANPQLSSVATAFEQALAHRTAVLETDSRIVKDLSTICNSILHLETMRSKSAEASAVVVKSTQIVTRCLDVCWLLESNEQITDDQKLMVSLMSKSDRQKTGKNFLGRAHDSTKSHMASMSAKIRGLRKSMTQLKEKYHTHISCIQYKVLNSHHKLISEVRAVLKTLAKEEMDEPELGCDVQTYLHDYKIFSEKLASLLRMAAQDDIDRESEAKIKSLTSELQADAESIFTRLIEIARPLSTQNPQPQLSPAGGARVTMSDTQHSPKQKDSKVKSLHGPNDGQSDKVFRDPKTGKAVQERNSYAVSVWRRVKMKLDGRELDPNKKMSVADQVAYIISEATDIRNLAQMYEGWTSWV